MKDKKAKFYARKRDGKSQWWVDKAHYVSREGFIKIPCSIVPADAFPSHNDKRYTDDIKLCDFDELDPSKWYWIVYFTHPGFKEVPEGECCPMLGEVRSMKTGCKK